MQILLVLTLLAGLPVQDGESYHANEDTFLRSPPLERANRGARVFFKHTYVGHDGSIDNNPRNLASTPQLEVARSPKTSKLGLQVAASVVAKVTKNMPGYIFKQLAKDGSVGVFTTAEKLTVYPEFAKYKKGNCGTSCGRACAHTCAPDGRKYEDLCGLGGKRAVVCEENLLCTKDDPFEYTQNIIVHELAHTIYSFALPLEATHEITAAYQNAKSKGIWEKTSYALSNELEYFAEGVSSFMRVTKNNKSSGGMAYCDGKWCPTLKSARDHLRVKDPALFKILSHVFTNDRPLMDPGVTICPPSE